MKKKILVVEDDADLSGTLLKLFRNIGYEVERAENGADALEKLKESPADVILMDVMMPVMDGLEATKRIKNDETLQKIPVIFLTAKSDPEDFKKAEEAGGDDYLVKPFKIKQLAAVVEKWLR